MIDPAAIAKLVAGVMVCWIGGFGIGKAVAYVRALRSAA